MSSTSSADSNFDNSEKADGAVGVQDLIDRLKSEGVQEGKQQAEALLAEAKRQAASIVEAARAESEQILQVALNQAQRTETNGKRALSLASRDTSLHLREQLEHEFRSWIGSLVKKQLDEPEFLAALIREMAGRVVASVNPTSEATVPNSESRQPGAVMFLVADQDDNALEAYVRNQTAEMLEQGVQLQADRKLAHGFRVRLEGNQTEIDFTEETVTAALMRFLAPKFRRLIGSTTPNSASE